MRRRLGTQRYQEVNGALRRLSSQVRAVEAAIVAVTDTRFDGHAYRRAVYASVRDDVYTRLRNVVSIISFFIGLGLFAFISTQAQTAARNSLDTLVREKEGQLAQLSTAARRAWLATYLERLSDPDRSFYFGPTDRDKAIIADLEKERESIALLDVMISDGSDTERRLALRYAKLANSQSARTAVVAKFDEVLGRQDTTFAQELLVDLMSLSIDDATLGKCVRQLSEALAATGEHPRIEVAQALSVRPAAMPAARKLLHDILTPEGVRAASPDLIASALVFRVRFPDSSTSTPSTSDSLDKEPLIRDLARLANLRARSSTRLSAEDAAVATRVLDQSYPDEDATRRARPAAHRASGRSSEKERRTAALTDPQIKALSLTLATWLAQNGFHERLYDDFGQYVTETSWNDDLADYFPDLGQAEFREVEATFARRPFEYVWDPQSRTYSRTKFIEARRAVETPILTSLKAGDPTPYLQFMDDTYFRAIDWKSNLYPLFPDYPRDPPTDEGDDGEQDHLWRWVQDSALRWNGSLYTLEKAGD